MTERARRFIVARPSNNSSTARRARKSNGANAPVAKPKSGEVPAEDVFRERAEARAILVEANLYDFHDAIDGLQHDAVRTGLVARIGQDKVQAILAHVFKNLPRPEPTGNQLRHLAQLANARVGTRVAWSTLRAAEYLLRQNDPARLRAWLGQHTSGERAAILEHIRGMKR